MMNEGTATGAGLRGGADEALLWVRALEKEFELKRESFWSRAGRQLRAVDRVSFDVRAGETFGLVGESGCGKSTIARCILRLIPPDGGEVYFDGRALSGLSRAAMMRLRRRMQIVFQDPHASLDPRMSVLEIVGEPLRVHGLRDARERREQVEAILNLVGITPEQIDRKPHAFSGGQRQRIAIARSLILEPELVVLDEPVSALDVSIQAQILNLLRGMQERLSLTYVFIVHDLVLAEYFCDRLAVLYLGAVMELADRETLFHQPLHPYTVALLSAVPTPDPAGHVRRDRIVLRGEVDAQSVFEPGCRFRSRCPVGKDREICHVEEPPLVEQSPGHWAACHFPGELSRPGTV